MQTKMISYRNQPLSYQLTGSGLPVVLVHGFGETVDVWQQQVHHLEKKYRLILPGISGSGLSVYNPELISLDDYAGSIKTILEAENIPVCAMLGHSMGGYIAMAFAVNFPKMLNALGLMHSSAAADNQEKIATRKKSIEFILSNGSAAYFKTSVPGLFSEKWAAANPLAVQELIEQVSFLLPEALAQQQQAMIGRPDRTEVLKNFSRPVLFIMGKQDKAVPFDIIMPQCYLPAESHIHILEQSGHMGMWEEPEKTNAALTGFLGRIYA
ncbi:MAG: alpha/beta hydrolase [Ferruginibacter sp.]